MVADACDAGDFVTCADTAGVQGKVGEPGAAVKDTGASTHEAEDRTSTASSRLTPLEAASTCALVARDGIRRGSLDSRWYVLHRGLSDSRT